MGVRTADLARRQAAAGRICKQYWKSAYAYICRHLRHKGQDLTNEEAKDLTQTFFAEVVWEGRLLQRADPAKGRFRWFLQKALKNYLTDVHRKRKSRKRAPERWLVSLDGIEGPIPQADRHATPAEAFTFAWASQLLDEVLAAVAEGCQRSGQHKHRQVFHRTVLEPVLTGADKPPLWQLCAELGVKSTREASAMNMTVKRRFRAAVEGHVRELVTSDDEVEQEIRELMAILSGPSVGRVEAADQAPERPDRCRRRARACRSRPRGCASPEQSV